MKNRIDFLRVITVLALAANTSWAWAQSSRSASGALRPNASLPDLCVLTRERGPSRDTAIVAKPLPHDSRLVVFPYDRNALFPINTAFNRFTHLEFEEGERIKAAYINDESEWEQRVSGTGTDIFVRPRIRGALGSMTVITERRRYQIDLLDISGCPQESRYQRVSWQIADGSYEDRDLLSRGRGSLPGAPQAISNNSPFPPQTEPRAAGVDGVGQDMVQLSRLNTSYDIEGDSDLRPAMVFDDGQRTWIQFARETTLRPALFGVTVDGQGDPVEYAPRGNYFVVARVFNHGLLLKLGKQEVRIRNRSAPCSLLDSRCRKVEPSNLSREGQ
jgi:type IV secretion system protein VirB9